MLYYQHDIHAKVEGPIVLDIKQNFEDRWCQQAGEDMENELFDMDLDPLVEHPEFDGGPWTMQLFRSITNGSCVMKEDSCGIERKGGKIKEGHIIERSIQKCMIREIRQAKNFIYLENQYFLGSAQDWLQDRDTRCQHLIPTELTNKIVEKISSHEPFKVYIVIPIHPEGDPANHITQEILFWQYCTMEFMYKKIGNAIVEHGIEDAHPLDYLAFFCLAKRESLEENDWDELQLSDPDPDTDTLAEKLRKTLRQPVYVHSKMSIFDDEYILVGSANINQRSLGGNRDTEIAVGGYQPGHTVDECGDPRGAVHTFRMALWSAHFGGYDEAYLNPASDDCLGKVREMSDGFWEIYTQDEPQHSDCHILPYPINVDGNGKVTALDEPWNCFPDTIAPVLGEKSSKLDFARNLDSAKKLTT